MAKVISKDIRNICLIGHSADGKTSLAEAMLYLTKATDRLGNITDGNTVCDFDVEETKRGFSISAALAPVSYNGKKINVIDAPGYLGFQGEVSQALRVAGAALIVVSAKAGVEVGTEIAWNNVSDRHTPHAFFINKFDESEVNFEKTFASMRDTFGSTVCPVVIPLTVNNKIVGLVDLLDMTAFGFGKGEHSKTIDIPAECTDYCEKYHEMLWESIASTDETLMEKYFNGETFTREEAVHAIHAAVRSGDIAPVLCGSATNLCGVEQLMKFIAESFPSPLYHKAEILIDDDGNETEAKTHESGEPSIFVFKTVADQFGKLTYFKVMSGELTNGKEMKNITTGQV
ncbi:MAG: GTP-binding protein [Clostridia bacterium]|nr:GTP-binding protein [Clostridia bacterium]